MSDNDLQAIRDFAAQPHSDTGWVVFAQTAVPALLAERDALAAEVATLRAQLAGVQDTIVQLQQDAEELSGRYA